MIGARAIVGGWSARLWLVPAVVLAWSGLAKLVAPGGMMPAALASLLDVAPHRVWLGLLGAVELGLVAAMIWPRTRRPALLVSTALVISFSLLVGWSATDRAFLGDCGCFGRWHPTAAYHGWLVLRNGALVLGIVLAFGLLRSGWRWSRALRVAGTVAAFAVLVPGLVGEMRLRQESYDELAAAVAARRTLGGHGQPLPTFPLTDRTGRSVSSDEVLGGGDLVVFLSRDCPHCLALGPSLAAEDRRRNGADDGRVVIVLIDADRIDDRWLASLGAEQVTSYATRSRWPLRRVGVDQVPHLLLLGPEGTVDFNPAHPVPPSLWKSLSLVESRVPGVADPLWSAIGSHLFGDGATLDGGFQLAAEAAVATVLDASGRPRGRIAVVQDGWRLADVVELAVGLDTTGRIVGIVPLSAGAQARVFTPELAALDSLVDLDLDRADRWLGERSRRPALDQPVWQSVRRALARVPR